MSGQEETRFAGLPTEVADKAAAAKVSGVSYTLPKSLVGQRWDLEEKYLKFTFTELTPTMQHQAAKLAKDNPSLLQQELLFASISHVGGRPVKADRDFLEQWWRKIGPRPRMLVTTAFGEMVSVDEADTAAFLASRED